MSVLKTFQPLKNVCLLMVEKSIEMEILIVSTHPVGMNQNNLKCFSTKIIVTMQKSARWFGTPCLFLTFINNMYCIYKFPANITLDGQM